MRENTERVCTDGLIGTLRPATADTADVDDIARVTGHDERVRFVGQIEHIALIERQRVVAAASTVSQYTTPLTAKKTPDPFPHAPPTWHWQGRQGQVAHLRLSLRRHAPPVKEPLALLLRYYFWNKQKATVWVPRHTSYLPKARVANRGAHIIDAGDADLRTI